MHQHVIFKRTSTTILFETLHSTSSASSYASFLRCIIRGTLSCIDKCTLTCNIESSVGGILSVTFLYFFKSSLKLYLQVQHQVHCQVNLQVSTSNVPLGPSFDEWFSAPLCIIEYTNKCNCKCNLSTISSAPLSATLNSPSSTCLCRSLGAFLGVPYNVLSGAPSVAPSNGSSIATSNASFSLTFGHSCTLTSEPTCASSSATQVQPQVHPFVQLQMHLLLDLCLHRKVYS